MERFINECYECGTPFTEEELADRNGEAFTDCDECRSAWCEECGYRPCICDDYDPYE